MNIRLCHALGMMLIAMTPSLACAASEASGQMQHAPDHWPGRHATGLVRVVRESTAQFHDLQSAEAAGYGRFLGCTSSHMEGAMGIHYANGVLVGDGLLDATRPEVLVYEPRYDGRLRLAAVDYLVIAEAWDAANAAPPVLMGQLFHYTGSPNRYGLPPFYALHVWAWKHNPHGAFANWNPRVSCEDYVADPD